MRKMEYIIRSIGKTDRYRSHLIERPAATALIESVPSWFDRLLKRKHTKIWYYTKHGEFWYDDEYNMLKLNTSVYNRLKDEYKWWVAGMI